MKRLVFLIALALGLAGSAAAQEAYNIGSYKANDLCRRAAKQLDLHTAEGVDAANSLYHQADSILSLDIAKASAKKENGKLAKLYIQRAELFEKLLSPQVSLASQGVPFDTLKFCTYVDSIITGYNQASAFNTMPNAKGRVKSDPLIAMHTKLGILARLTLYYNCGAFQDAMGNKQGSINYFQKFVDLPRVTPVFTATERDSVYKANAQAYGLARFNLALQNYYLKNWDAALKSADEALKDTMNINDLFLIKLNALGEKKDSVAWQHALVEAAQRTGKISFLQNLIVYYMQNNKIADADALASKLTTERPDDKMAWYIKGAIELNIKRNYAGSRADFQKALDIDPDYSEALYNMGTAYINDIYEQRTSGKFKYIGTNRRITGKAGAEYNKQKAIYDKEIATVKSYYEKALPYLEKFRQLNPTDVKRWAPSLQMVYEALGQKDKAKEMDTLLEEANANN